MGFQEKAERLRSRLPQDRSPFIVLQYVAIYENEIDILYSVIIFMELRRVTALIKSAQLILCFDLIMTDHALCNSMSAGLLYNPFLKAGC